MTNKTKIAIVLALILALMVAVPPKQTLKYHNPSIPNCLQVKLPQFSISKANAEGQSYTLAVLATAYWTHVGGHGIAADGNPAIAYHTLAVDPNVIPFGSRVHVPGIGWMLAHDTGGLIKGNRIDIAMESTEAAINWGIREVTITVIPPK